MILALTPEFCHFVPILPSGQLEQGKLYTLSQVRSSAGQVQASRVPSLCQAGYQPCPA
ncbi:hypothetical protein ACQKFM_29885 [Paenibacillus xylanexedens]|uniref:hypothetical protein n=1 Tax=Paenibacillus xylanexedens TaxID=528191 RepID=UPI003D017F3A